MTRAQIIALWMIGALAVVAYLQSYEVARALSGLRTAPPLAIVA